MTREQTSTAAAPPSSHSSIRTKRIASFLQDVEPFLQGRKIIYVDVGAYRGEVLEEIRKFPLRLHEAHLLEPNPRAFAVLEEVARARRGPGRAICYNLAVSNQPGTLRLRDAESMTQVVASLDATFPEGVFEVKAITLDQLAERLPDRRISLLKIDVEGYERQVLEGARGLLAAEAVDLIYIEAGVDPAGTQQTYYRAIEDLLAAHGYRLFGIYEQHNRWIEDSPLLRRANLAFMSRSFAAQNPYQLSRDLLNLRKEMAVLTERLARAEARLAERSAAAEPLERQVQLQAAEIACLTAAVEAERVAGARQARGLEIELGELRAYTRDLESLHLGVLRSRSWRSLEPVRRVSRRLLARKTPPPFVPRLTGGDAHGAAAAAGATDHTGLPTADLVAKLWSGFSQPASADLSQLLNEEHAAPKDRVAAAWNLARWSAAGGDWDKSLSYLIALSKIDKASFRAKRTRLLIVEAYVQTGNPDKAIEYAEYGAAKETDGNYLCGLSNAYLAKAEGTGRLDDERLAALNRGYEAAGLAPLELIDPAAGLVFGNIAAKAAAGTTEGPKISILVPVYNAAGFVEAAIGSLLAQTWRNLEIVAVDDASSDDSWRRLEALVARDPRLRILRNGTNIGAYPTRNRALEAATGEIVTVHDSDDWSHPQMLERQVDALLRHSDRKATISMMARVGRNMAFALRPERNNLEYVHRSYPSLMMRRSDLALLDRWDGVAANADDELVQRLRAVWGPEALKDILPGTPLSFFLRHDQSLTEQKGTHLRSLTFGIRQEYAKQAEFWRTRATPAQLASGSMVRRDLKTPFPIPNGLAPRAMRRPPVYDLVIISDLSLLGGTRRCNEGYLEAATALGLRVGLFHWPRYDLVLAEVAPEYRQLSYQPNIDILVPEDEVSCTATLLHHPPILKHPIDALPRIRTGRLGVLVNQLPMQLKGASPHYYYPEAVGELCRGQFGLDPEWIPISPLTRRWLQDIGGFDALSAEDWFPPLGRELVDDRPQARGDVGAARRLVLGRHSRDHWTKWPGDAAALCAAYCADSDIDVRLMGGVSTPRKMLGRLPSNWRAIGFDQVPVEKFLGEIDVFLHFINEGYIEEFGRNVMEAMAQGIPAILPEDFRETFGGAARYCAPEAVAEVARGLWADRDAYATQAAEGYAFVRRTSGQARVRERLAAFVGQPAAR